MEKKKVLLFTYSKANFGDDLFVYILANRYKNIEFYIQIQEPKYKKAFENLHNVIILNEAREVDKINVNEFDAFVYVGGSIFIESEYGKHEAKEFNKFIKDLNPEEYRRLREQLRNIEDEERRFPRSIEKEDVNEEKEVVTDAMKSEELVETEESESL